MGVLAQAWGAVAREAVAEVAQPLRFQGQYADAETGLHYNRHRYYSPGEGRFLNQDPIRLAGGLNIAAYAPNAVCWIDPYGLSCGYPEEGIVTEQGKPWEGVAHQDQSPASLVARTYAEQGGRLYRIGTMGKSGAGEAQFWATEDPHTPGYAARFGIPKENVVQADFLEVGRLKPGTQFVTRPAPAPAGGVNPGGGVEVVVPANGVQLDSFHAGHVTPYTGN